MNNSEIVKRFKQVVAKNDKTFVSETAKLKDKAYRDDTFIFSCDACYDSQKEGVIVQARLHGNPGLFPSMVASAFESFEDRGFTAQQMAEMAGEVAEAMIACIQRRQLIRAIQTQGDA